MKIRYFLFCLLFLIPGKNTFVFSQFKPDPHFGFSAGMVINIGTHVNTFGAVANFYYSDFFYQLNAQSQFKFNFKSYGGRSMFWENRNALGIVLLAGKRNITPDFQLDALNHQTRFSKGIAYNYIWYFDQAATSQRSGAWALHINHFFIAHENDVFGAQSKDRFRTAILHLSYRYEEWKFFTNLFIWTGETRESKWDKTPLPGAPNGYRDLSPLPYGKTSHGIWSFGVTRHLMYNQTVGLKTGIDSEHIRHAVQNKFAHDLILFPKSFPRNTPHYPRLDQDGMPVFNKEKARKSRLFLEVNMNEIYSN